MFTRGYDHEQRSWARARHPWISDVAQWEWELDELTRMFQELAPRTVLELGVWQGGTLIEWMALSPSGVHVIGIDQNDPRPEWKGWGWESGITLDYIQGDTHANSTLTTLNNLLMGKPIDFLFIDADHSEAGATQDFELYGPLVRPGGLIALHDILDPHPSRNQDHVRVSRLWERIRRAGYVTRELIAHPDQEWGGIGVVFV